MVETRAAALLGGGLGGLGRGEFRQRRLQAGHPLGRRPFLGGLFAGAADLGLGRQGRRQRRHDRPGFGQAFFQGRRAAKRGRASVGAYPHTILSRVLIGDQPGLI